MANTREEPIIDNGGDTRPVLAYLPSLFGTRIPVRSYESVEVFAALNEAVGVGPAPPDASIGGYVESTPAKLDDAGHVLEYAVIYNPANDVANTANVEAYKVRLQAWLSRVNLLVSLANALIKKGKK